MQWINKIKCNKFSAGLFYDFGCNGHFCKKSKSEFLECIILLFQFEVPQKIFDDFDFFEILEAQILSGRLR